MMLYLDVHASTHYTDVVIS